MRQTVIMYVVQRGCRAAARMSCYTIMTVVTAVTLTDLTTTSQSEHRLLCIITVFFLHIRHAYIRYNEPPTRRPRYVLRLSVSHARKVKDSDWPHEMPKMPNVTILEKLKINDPGSGICFRIRIRGS